MRFFIGIDPGLDGAIAAVDYFGEPIAWRTMPVEEYQKDRFRTDIRGVRDFLKQFTTAVLPTGVDPVERCIDLVVVEKQPIMPASSKLSIAVQHEGFGELRALLLLSDYKHVEPMPQTWKGSVLKGTKKDKHAAVYYCKRRFPNVDFMVPRTTGRRRPGEPEEHDGLAEAFCMAVYGMNLVR